MASKSTGNWIERAWRPILEGIESGRARRGKASHKQGAIAEFSISDGFYEARVKQPGYSQQNIVVRMPTVDWWIKFEGDVAVWFCRRPDWLASLMQDEWEPDWAEFVESAGLRLFPQGENAEHMLRLATCTCPDKEKPCQHVASLVYAIMTDITERPIRILEHVGLKIPSLLDKTHAFSVGVQTSQANSGVGIDRVDSGSINSTVSYEREVPAFELWDEEKQVFSQNNGHGELEGGTEKTSRLSFRVSEERMRRWCSLRE